MKEKILEELKKSDSKKIKIAITDIDGILRGKVIHKDKFMEIAESSFGFCNVIFGWDSNDSCYDNSEYTGWHTGYPDDNVYIDLASFRKVPWDNNIPFFIGDMSGNVLQKNTVCPRSLLKNIIADCDALNIYPKFAVEYEWFNFEKSSINHDTLNSNTMKTISKGMYGYSLLKAAENRTYYNDLFDYMNAYNIPIEGLHTETGPGVYEAAIRYDTTLHAADKATLFKTGVKEIACLHNIVPSFMAKWNEELPGCGAHIHQSLWNKNGDSLFYNENNPDKMSDSMQHYLAGIIHCLPHILPMYAPTINSYKRLIEGAWAPTTASWGIENRTTAIRIINNNAKNIRIENRVPGADINPYLAIAASLASGLYGIKNKLKLDTLPLKGNAYAHDDIAHIPNSLENAVSKMEASTIAKDLFGEVFTSHFIASRKWEIRQFSKAVTNWELNKYFEII